MLFFVSRNGLRCVRKYRSLTDGRRLALLEFGWSASPVVRVASLGELVDHKRGGGWIPIEYRDQVEAHEVLMTR